MLAYTRGPHVECTKLIDCAAENLVTGSFVHRQ